MRNDRLHRANDLDATVHDLKTRLAAAEAATAAHAAQVRERVRLTREGLASAQTSTPSSLLARPTSIEP